MQNNTNNPNHYEPVTLTPEMQAKAAQLIETLNADPAFTAALEARRNEEEAERFTIDSERAADWLLRKLAEIEGEKARVKAWYANRTAELDADAARLRNALLPHRACPSRCRGSGCCRRLRDRAGYRRQDGIGRDRLP
jgi:hypothetical protein